MTTANGRFTATTAAEVKRFQRFYQLKATGVADAHTLAVVRRVDKLDADATDAASGGSGLTSAKKVGQGSTPRPSAGSPTTRRRCSRATR